MAKILAVDDAGFVRRWCSRVLSDNGHEVLEAENGQQGVEIYKATKPDAVLLDVLMPVMDGLTALREIIAFDANARVAILTTQGQVDVVVEARRLGARDFIVKPCDTDRLLASVKRILS